MSAEAWEMQFMSGENEREELLKEIKRLHDLVNLIAPLARAGLASLTGYYENDVKAHIALNEWDRAGTDGGTGR